METVEEEVRWGVKTVEAPIEDPSVNGLLHAVRDVFRSRDKDGGESISSILYQRGSDHLVVEKRFKRKDEPFATPFAMIRNRAQLEILETPSAPLEGACSAVQALREDGARPTFIVASSSKSRVRKWLGMRIDLEKLFGVSYYRDPDAPPGKLFFAGSSAGPMLSQVEYCYVLSME